MGEPVAPTGTFERMFEDGARFLATQSTTVDRGVQTRVRIHASDSGALLEEQSF